jgi:peptidoglycan/LPS O-acetylase OafA/YrhL
MTSANNNKERFIGLEWLRFLLGVYVAIYHTIHMYLPADGTPLWLKELTGMGFFATSTFFVLSGFLLAHVYIDNDRMREPARSFWLKRFANLYPIHIFALLLAIANVFFMQSMQIAPDGTSANLRFVIYDTNELVPADNPTAFHHYMSNLELGVNLLLQATMLQAWNPLYLTFNAPLWSISVLFFFYLTFPLLAPRLMAARHPLRLLIVIGALYLVPPLLVIWHQNFGVPYTGILHRLPLLRLPEFLAGILMYAVFRRQKASGALPTDGVRWLLGAGVAIFFAVGAGLLAHGSKFWYFLLHNGLLLPSQLTLVYLSAMAREPDSQWLRRWSPRLGAASLSIFALHVPMIYGFRTVEKFVLGDLPLCFTDWAGCIQAASEHPNTVPGYLLLLALLVIVSLMFQERLVVPTRKWIIAKLSPGLLPRPAATP